MTANRAKKIEKIVYYIPKQEVQGKPEGDLLVVGWGGTYGALHTAVLELEEEGYSISLAQFNYINPLPYNVADIFSRFGKIIVCELNLGQFAQYLRSRLPDYNYLQFNKVQGLPFLISELKEKFREIIGKPIKK
jgi:2-oxoglutarate ferredoxin oxidoreductase subunit alpha